MNETKQASATEAVREPQRRLESIVSPSRRLLRLTFGLMPLWMMVAMGGVCRVAADEGSSLRFVQPDRASGTSAAVVVSPDVALAHTALMMPLDRQGQVVSKGNASAQADRVLSNLNWALAAAGSGREQTVKITIYAANHETLDAVRASVAQAFPGPTRPAATWVVNQQPDDDILVTMDAVAVAPLRDPDHITRLTSDQLSGSDDVAHVAVMPPGDVFHVAGQVAPGEKLADAAAKTTRELHRTLEHFGISASQVVRVKAFIQPMAESEDARRAIAAVYDDRGPAIVMTEWQAELPRPTEIELIAVNPNVQGDADAARYLTPPWLNASPVYSRVAAARADAHRGWVYFSGLTPDPERSPQDQVSQAFDRLQTLCRETDSDFNHLIKATYYVRDDAITKALGVVRPDYYDPERPPSASLIRVRGVADPDADYTLDMIGIRVE